MTENLYRVITDDSVIVARCMTLDTALLLIECLMNKYYNDPYIAYTIIKESPQQGEE